MNKMMLVLAAAAVSFSTVGADAGGWGRSGGNRGLSSGLINVSPSIGVGDVTALNNILSGNAILSGNVVSGILNGNRTNVGSGILNGIGANLFGGNSYSSHSYKMGRHHHRH